jgi:hypothetical protein
MSRLTHVRPVYAGRHEHFEALKNLVFPMQVSLNFQDKSIFVRPPNRPPSPTLRNGEAG